MSAAEIAIDTEPAVELKSPSEVFFCGNGYCDPGENSERCSQDCGLTIEWEAAIAPTLYQAGVAVKAELPCGWTGGGGWRRGARPEEMELPYWTFATHCPLAALLGGTPHDYPGRSARWTFTIRLTGFFRIDAWIPDGYYSCAPLHLLSEGVTYYLFGPNGHVDTVTVPQAGHDNSRLTLFDFIALPAGTYTLHLPDHASEGCACGTDARCPGDKFQTTRVYADTLYIQRR